ncbi:MAG: hypothetical protein ABI427_07085, partial [Solirubrobacteraceae bacterium]
MQLAQPRDRVRVRRVKGVQEAGRLGLGQDDLALIGKHFLRASARSAPEEVAQRFADRRRRGEIKRTLVVGKTELETLRAHNPSVRTSY